LFYIPRTKRNKLRKSKKRKPYRFKGEDFENANGKLSLRRSFFLPSFRLPRKSLTDRYKKFSASLPPFLYKKKGLRKNRYFKNPKFGSKLLFYSRKMRNKVGRICDLLSFASRPYNFRPYQKFQKELPFKKVPVLVQAIKYFAKKFHPRRRTRK
jgi:hypothetical protein